MAPSQRAKSIDVREWDRRKARISELYLNGTLRGVIDTMNQEGFTATESQYEAKLKVWGIHKYKKRRATTQNDQPARAAKSRRTRRNESRSHHEAGSVSPDYNDVNQTGGHHTAGLESDIDMLSIENVVEAATTTPGTETQCIASSQNVLSSRGNSNFGHSSNLKDLGEALSPTTFSHLVEALSPTAFLDLVELPSLAPSPNDLNSMNLAELPSPTASPNGFDMDWVESSSPAVRPHNVTRSITPIPSGGPSFSIQRNWVRPLTSIQVGAMIIKNTYSKSLANATPSISMRTNNPNFLYEFSNLVTPFRGSDTIQIPSRLYLEDVIAGEDWSQLGKIPEAVASEARFDARLIASVINRFAGLGNIPHSSVLEFLQRNGAIRGAVFNYLDTNSNSVAKSFAEKVFSASIKSDDLPAVIFLLRKGFVDANKAVCDIYGRRYTPLERAAISQSFNVVKYLVSRVDVNKSFSKDSSQNALELLIDHHVPCRQSALDENFIQLVDTFLKEKASISTRLVGVALKSFVDGRLASRLLKNLAAQTPHNLFSQNGILQDVVKNLKEQDAIEIVEFIIKECQKPGREIIMSQFRHQVNDASCEATERKYNQLVKVMLPYTPYPHTTLQKAKRTNNQVVIQLILEKNPGLDSHQGLEGNTEDGDTFISALKSNDQYVLRCLEKRGVFDRLQGHKLGLALTEALKAGNEEYAKKILDLDRSLIFYDKSTFGFNDKKFCVCAALRAALYHNFDNIAWKLLAVGLSIARSPPYGPSCGHLLRIAVEAKRPDILSAIIDSSPGSMPILDDDSWVLKLAIQSGQDSMFENIWKGRSFSFHPSRSLLKLTLLKKREDWFSRMIKSCPQNTRALSMGLGVAVECKAESLFDELMSLGARIDTVLEGAIYQYPSMAKVLLNRYWESYPQGRVGYCYGIIWRALNQRPSGLEPHSLSVDMLLTWNLIHPNHLLQEYSPRKYSPREYCSGEYSSREYFSREYFSQEYFSREYSSWECSSREYSSPDYSSWKCPSREYSSRETLLVMAIQTCNYKLVEKFIDAGSEANGIVVDESGSREDRPIITPLLAAIKTKIIKIVQLLIDHGAEVNKPTWRGIRRTPLQKAAEVDDIAIVNLLLDRGAEVNGLPAVLFGATALQFAAINGNCEMARILIGRGARNDIPPPRGLYGRWPLEGAAENGRFDMIELLWDAFGPLPDEQCQSAMRRAERNGHIGCKERIQELMAESPAPNNTLLLHDSIY